MKNKIWWGIYVLCIVGSVVSSILNPYVRLWGMVNIFLIFPVVLNFILLKLSDWAIKNAKSGGIMRYRFSSGSQSMEEQLAAFSKKREMMVSKVYINLNIVLIVFIFLLAVFINTDFLYGFPNIEPKAGITIEHGRGYAYLTVFLLVVVAVLSILKLRTLLDKRKMTRSNQI